MGCQHTGETCLNPFFKGFWANSFLKELRARSLFQGIWGSLAWGWPFSRLFGRVQHKLAHCICKGPEGWTFMVFAPSLDWVALQPPGAGLFDDIWLVIKDGLCLKPASLVHLPSKPRRPDAPVALYLFQSFWWQFLLNLLQGRIIPGLAF